MSEQTTAVESGHQHRIRDLASRLYRGEAGLDVVGKRKYFYGVAAGILLIGIITILIKPFNIGIEFKGGNAFTVPASVGTMADVRGTIENTGAAVASTQTVGGTNGTSYLIKTNPLDPDPSVADKKAADIKTAISERFHISTNQISE